MVIKNEENFTGSTTNADARSCCGRLIAILLDDFSSRKT